MLAAERLALGYAVQVEKTLEKRSQVVGMRPPLFISPFDNEAKASKLRRRRLTSIEVGMPQGS